MSVVIVDTRAANVASVAQALERVGVPVTRTVDPAVVLAADRVVLPGVGAFGSVRERLGDALALALAQRVQAGLPTLGICLGLQLFALGSDESPGVAGLGVLPVRLEGFPDGVRSPQLGWNGVQPSEGARWLQPGAAWFANSYRLGTVPPGWVGTWSSHGGPFVAALERGDVLLVQFHPELSGSWGLDLLRRWGLGLTAAGVRTAAPLGLTRRIVPCLDVRDGRVVKGVRFAGLRDAGDPASLAQAYADQGADELCLLDVSATPDGRKTAAATVAAVRARLSLSLTVGGGVRTLEDARRLLDAGADKVAVNTAAVADPALLSRLAEAFGQQCIVLAVDAASRTEGQGWEVVVRSGTTRTGIDAVAWCKEGQERGAGEVLLTSWDRDGTRAGYDLPLVGAVADRVRVPVIASGGASVPDDLADAFEAGADAALAASVFHDGELTVADIKARLAARGIHIRPVGPQTGGAL